MVFIMIHHGYGQYSPIANNKIIDYGRQPINPRLFVV
jgi:hypothetical protein